MKKYLFLLLIIILASCESDDNNDNEVKYRGTWFLNQGGFAQNNSSITHLSDDGDLSQNIFLTENELSLGDTGNGMIKINDKIYILLGGSKILEIVDFNSAKSIKSISMDFSNYPYTMQEANGIIYISDLYLDKIYRFDISSEEFLSEEITSGPGPENVSVSAGKIFVANSGLGTVGDTLPGSRTVYIYDENTLEKLSEVSVGPNTRFVYSDNQYFYAGYSNFWGASDLGGIKKFDINTFQLVAEWKADIQSNFVNTNNGLIYLTNMGVERLLISDTEKLFDNPNPSEFWSGISYSSDSDEIYIFNAVDYQIDGFVYILNNEAQITDTINAGIIPIAFVK